MTVVAPRNAAAANVPRLVVAAPGSGHGKTSVATGLLGALRQRGLTVSPHKVGPDYIDPGYHALAAGRPGRNLDPWLVGEERIAAMFAHGASTPTLADIAVIEGVMGLFDGASERDDFASTAHVARLLRAPVVLVVDASGVSASVAALLHGFATFDPATRIGGVIFNQVGSDYHAYLLTAAAERAGVPVLGAIRRLDALAVPSRHLGLIPAAERGRDAMAAVDALSAAVAASVDLDAVLQLARTAGPLSITETQITETQITGTQITEAQIAEPQITETQDPSIERTVASRSPVTIAVAGGPAFTFGYAEHPELLAAAGAEVAVFDPLRDEELPDGAAGLVIGGGFPEVHAAQLSANTALKSQVAALARSGAPVLAECAGLLYLARSLEGEPMCGVLGIDAEMTGTLTLGYRDAVAVTDSPLAPVGTRAHGHEFHRTAIRAAAASASVGAAPAGAANAWRWQARGAVVAEGFVQAGVHASYLHTHWNGLPGAADRIVAAARAYR